MTSPTTRIENLWVARTPLTDPPAELRRTRFDRIGRAVAWPLAVALVLHRVFVLALNGSVTDDFTTVYAAVRRALDGVPVYNEIYHHVDPHYLYNPGATLLLMPLGWLSDIDAARTAFIIANAAAVIAALALLTRMFGWSLRSFVWPAAVAFAFLTESVRNTLIFSNINGMLLLALAGFLALLLSGRRWRAGLLIGVAILIKPQFAPLLFLPAVKLDWRTVLGGLAVPVVFNLAAWPVVPGAGDYLTRLVPYLGEVRDYANSSLAGAAVYFGMPAALETALWLLFAVIVAVGVIVLLRWRYTDPLLWATTTTGLLLAGVFFLSSLGQMYYSMMLFPMMFTVLQRTSVFHTWPAWLAAYLFLTPDSFHSTAAVDLSRWMAFFHPTIGWALLLVAVTTSALVWWREESLDLGHDRLQTDQRHRVAPAPDA
ncbi:glycosyltransferase family 87 protein [Corynebacterium hylobatis]|uniref:glycosyltransferase family 87 protein n=1 Tax=Corynebacterium hylobatis TaxID=1859290 RepID=UPI0019D21953|nr:glycosyltransferase family 87 protein [Corynebacterium hylobatis]